MLGFLFICILCPTNFLHFVGQGDQANWESRICLWARSLLWGQDWGMCFEFVEVYGGSTGGMKRLCFPTIEALSKVWILHFWRHFLGDPVLHDHWEGLRVFSFVGADLWLCSFGVSCNSNFEKIIKSVNRYFINSRLEAKLSDEIWIFHHFLNDLRKIPFFQFLNQNGDWKRRKDENCKNYFQHKSARTQHVY